MYLCNKTVKDTYLQDILKRQESGEKMTVLEEIVASMASDQMDKES